jgi:hypothetical protein
LRQTEAHTVHDIDEAIAPKASVSGKASNGGTRAGCGDSDQASQKGSGSRGHAARNFDSNSFVNVVDLFKLTSPKSIRVTLGQDFDSLFTTDKPIISTSRILVDPSHIYRRTNHRNLHVRGYKKEQHQYRSILL